ncbi:MAG: hypothetical protein ACRDP8_13225 [Actinopolymorphaceae bacterium]
MDTGDEQDMALEDRPDVEEREEVRLVEHQVCGRSVGDRAERTAIHGS